MSWNCFGRWFRANPARQAERLRRMWTNPTMGFKVSDILSFLSSTPRSQKSIRQSVDVVIPVYNGLQHLLRLFPLLFANTSLPHRFIIVNDCSTDPETRKYVLQQISGRTDCVFLENTSNLGFTATVNRGVELVESDVFVLLNTDVMVPPTWLERLVTPFFLNRKVGTTTPFTNAGSFYSFPNVPRDHALNSDEDFIRIDEAFQKIVVKDWKSLEFINGTGFCMAIRKSCWDRYGGLDVETFGKGYGEECDLSFRYLDHGYINIVVPNLFVYHKHGGSFHSEERTTLAREHGRILAERWGKYIDLLPLFAAYDPWAQYRLAALCVLYAGRVDKFFTETCEASDDLTILTLSQEHEPIQRGECVVTVFHTKDSTELWYLTFPNKDGRAVFRMSGRQQTEQWVDLLRNPLSI